MKKIKCFIVMVMCLVLCLGATVPVHAAEVKQCSVSISANDGSYQVYTFYNLPLDTVSAVLRGDYVREGSRGLCFSLYSLDSFSNVYYDCQNYDSFGVLISEVLLKEASYADVSISEAGETIYRLDVKNSEECFSTPKAGFQYSLIYSGELYNADCQFYEFLHNGSFGDIEYAFSDSDYVFTDELGYVKGVDLTTAYLKLWDELNEQYYNPVDSDGEIRIKWEEFSTSGFDLLESGTYVRVYTRAHVHSHLDDGHKITDWQVPVVGSNYNFIEQVSASELEYRISLEDLYSASAQDYEEIRAQFESGLTIDVWNEMQMFRCDDIVLQIIHPNENGYWNCGGYLVVQYDCATKGYEAVAYTPGNTIDDNAGGTQYVENNSDTGTSYDDVYDKVDNGSTGGSGDIWDFLTNGSIDEMLARLNSLVTMVGQWPSIIGDVFSFLPSWCLDFLGFSLAISSVIMIWKVLRG